MKCMAVDNVGDLLLVAVDPLGLGLLVGECPDPAVAQTWNPACGDRSGGVATYCQNHLDERRELGDVEWPVDADLGASA